VERAVSRETDVGDGDPDLPDLVEREELGVDLLLLRVDRVQCHPLGVEDGEDLGLQLDEDRIDALGGVDTVDEGDELLLELEPPLQDLNTVLLRQPVPS
jgi:hypothetical protein